MSAHTVVHAACSQGFEVCLADTAEALAEACWVRALAYGHHLGGAAGAGFAATDPMDEVPGAVVLLCRDTATGQAVGTARINVGDASHALLIEGAVTLPSHMAACPRAEVTRLAVLAGADPLVKLCLMKAVYRHCVEQGLDWLVIAARNDALARNYRRLGFKDFLGAGQMMPLPYAGHLPHYIFTMDVRTIREQWTREGHRLLGFMVASSGPSQPSAQHAGLRRGAVPAAHRLA